MSEKPTLYCTFCGKSQSAVDLLFAAKQESVLICDECIDLCATICAERRQKHRAARQLNEIRKLGT